MRKKKKKNSGIREERTGMIKEAGGEKDDRFLGISVLTGALFVDFRDQNKWRQRGKKKKTMKTMKGTIKYQGHV